MLLGCCIKIFTLLFSLLDKLDLSVIHNIGCSSISIQQNLFKYVHMVTTNHSGVYNIKESIKERCFYPQCYFSFSQYSSVKFYRPIKVIIKAIHHRINTISKSKHIYFLCRCLMYSQCYLYTSHLINIFLIKSMVIYSKSVLKK